MDFTEVFYWLSIQLGHTEKGEESIEIYVNGLKYPIWDELILSMFRTVREAYHIALKVEEKLEINLSMRLYL